MFCTTPPHLATDASLGTRRIETRRVQTGSEAFLLEDGRGHEYFHRIRHPPRVCPSVDNSTFVDECDGHGCLHRIRAIVRQPILFLRVEWHVDDFGVYLRGMERDGSIRVIGPTASKEHDSRADGPACLALVHRRVRPQRSVRSLRRGLSDHNPTEVKTIKSGLLKPFRRITSIITIMPLPTCIPRGCSLCCCSVHHTPTYLCQTSQS